LRLVCGNAGNEATPLKVLLNITKPLALGYYMVKNRSPQELEANVSAEEARRSEMDFLQGSRCDGVWRRNKKLSACAWHCIRASANWRRL
jgi:hypothetical protein